MLIFNKLSNLKSVCRFYDLKYFDEIKGNTI